jgi:hypothetical protein
MEITKNGANPLGTECDGTELYLRSAVIEARARYSASARDRPSWAYNLNHE